jgi:hypothetical protein
MVVGLPVREQRKIVRDDEDEHTDLLDKAWTARRKDRFDVNPEAPDENGFTLDYAHALESESPATIRAKCAAILAGRKVAPATKEGT